MAGIEIFSSPPKSFVAGDTVKWKIAGGNFPASSWTRSVILTSPDGKTRETFSADADGDDFIVTLKANKTRDWVPGDYEWAEVAKSGSDEKTVATGEMTINANPRSTPVQRTHAEKVLENLQAVIEGRALINQDIEASNINGQEIRRMSSADLLTWFRFYKAQVLAERQKRTGKRRISRIVAQV